MTAQTPAEGILVRGNHDSFDTFHVTCDCSDSDHAIEVFISRENDLSDRYVTIEFYTTFNTRHGSFWERVKMAIILLYTGFITVQRGTILTEQTAINFGTALIDTVNKYQVELERKSIKTEFKKANE